MKKSVRTKYGLMRRLRNMKYAYNRFHTHFMHGFVVADQCIGSIAFLASIICIVCCVISIGFDHTTHNALLIRKILRAVQIIFIVKVLYGLLFNFKNTCRNTRLFKWIADIAILITLLPLLYPHPEHPWLPWLEHILYNNKIIFSVTGLYALIELCYGIIRTLNRKVNPTVIMAISFIFFIIVGSFVLMMPKCTYAGIDYIDSLFVSTSAVCITGLTPVDLPTTFTPFGILVLSILVQIGGLGVMTFTSFFALFFSGNTSVYSQLAVRDMIYSKSINSLLPTLLYILGFTLVIEAVGAIAIFASVHGTLGMSVDDELIFSGFHSLTAFCNAGFSNIEGGLSNPALLHSNQMVYIIASLLIFAGGIGFPILVNFKTAAACYLRKLWNRICGRRRSIGNVHIYDMNTRIAMTTTLVVFAVSSLLFFIFEYNNSLDGMSLYDKIVQSVFNSFVPRSSGFSSVNPAAFLNITLIMMIILMWIGGASQSTAGGIKVNTFAVMLMHLKAVVRGRNKVVAFNREISHDSINRALAVVTLSIVGYIIYSMLLIAFEPALPAKDLLFESASALFTVGSSLGITPSLGVAAKILLCTAMFFGRVGMLSLLIGLVGKRGDKHLGYTTDNVIIN